MIGGLFWFGSWLIPKGALDDAKFSDTFRVLFAIVFAAETMGEDATLAPDLGEAKTAASRVINLLNREVSRVLYQLASTTRTFETMYTF